MALNVTMRALRAAYLVLVVLAVLLAAPAVSADERQYTRLDGAMTWGVAGFEIATTAALMLRLSVWRGPMEEGAEGLLLTAPFLIGTGSGVAGGLWCLPPRIPLGLHGGLYTGLAAGLATALVRGALSEGGTLRFDSVAGIGALVGIAPGLLIGALEVDPDDPLAAWLGGPPAGFLGGVVVAGILAVVAFLSGNDPGGAGAGDQLIGWPIFAGLATGLVVATGSVLE